MKVKLCKKYKNFKKVLNKFSFVAFFRNLYKDENSNSAVDPNHIMAVASYELSQDKQRTSEYWFCAHYTTRTINICQKYPSYGHSKNYKTQSPLAAIIILLIANSTIKKRTSLERTIKRNKNVVCNRKKNVRIWLGEKMEKRDTN